MQESLELYNEKHRLFQKGDTLIVAVSGGKDSMVLLDLLRQLPVTCIVAHCNYKLRGVESDGDESFVREYCELYDLAFHAISFDTLAISAKKKQSIQEVARDLRYTWLGELRKKERAQAIVTAHHLQDNIETMLFNLSKGTGVKGLRGMLPKQGKIIRPMLAIPQDTILAYLTEKGIAYREDSSNIKLDYDRNKLRHEVLPVLKTINPGFEHTMQEHFMRWQEIAGLYEEAIQHWRKTLFEFRNGGVYISIRRLLIFEFSAALLYELLAPYGFNQQVLANVHKSLQTTELKLFYSEDYVLLKDRQFIILQEQQLFNENRLYLIHRKATKLEIGNHFLLQIQFKPMDKLSKMNQKSNWAYLDADKLQFPLVIRKWKDGDYFYPYGLLKASGKLGKKKVGKFLRDEKLDALSKANTYVVLSGQYVVCVLGYRMDARFAVDQYTKEVGVFRIK